jgi:puromycin-sensitive aminopeptidase
MVVDFFGSSQDLVPSEVVQFEEDEILVLGFDRELPIGEGVLTMDFKGTLNDQMRGFYRRYTALFFLQIPVHVRSRWTPIIGRWLCTLLV